MQILALDASTKLCTAALGDGAVWHERAEDAGQRHSELLLPMIRELLAAASIVLSELGGIAFGAGPGSFTGLRIACGVAQGLAFGAGLPVVGVSTLEAMAEAARVHHGATRVIAALDARMHEIYVAAYEHDDARWREIVEPVAVDPRDAPFPPGRDWVGVGAGFAAYPELGQRLDPVLGLRDEGIAPTAVAIGALALPRFLAGEGVQARDAVPVYVRQRVALTAAERAAGLRL
jgi:tRNA threonylcarbamoyladenosine biosynthesis protein TsaB